ncbi:Uncharacterised protein [[Clostridium] sordellii]|uniref:hypothetical protein n=1 Tax=Paraclostridium sordellii TaxID=1505 RepID=UPI0005DB32B0|nr:hypothetical protein [Paeniclostridium sordellii]CEQ01696.1 Uncharacterised protein [[Clostridium] sordellii] [Paeniclostridium sordellii]
MRKIIENLALVLMVTILVTNTNLNVFSLDNKEDIKPEKQIECYQLADDGDIQITFNDGSSEYLNIFYDVKEFKLINSTYLKIDNSIGKINNSDIDKIKAFENMKKELNKLPENVLSDLKYNYNLEISAVNKIEDSVVFGKKIDVAGEFITYNNENKNKIVVEYDQVEHALLHEIGHALVKVWALHEEDQIQKSFNDKEFYFGSDYYYEDINEYIAEGIKHYYRDDLDNGDLKQALDKVLNVYNEYSF